MTKWLIITEKKLATEISLTTAPPTEASSKIKGQLLVYAIVEKPDYETAKALGDQFQKRLTTVKEPRLEPDDDRDLVWTWSRTFTILFLIPEVDHPIATMQVSVDGETIPKAVIKGKGLTETYFLNFSSEPTDCQYKFTWLGLEAEQTPQDIKIDASMENMDDFSSNLFAFVKSRITGHLEVKYKIISRGGSAGEAEADDVPGFTCLAAFVAGISYSPKKVAQRMNALTEKKARNWTPTLEEHLNEAEKNESKE